jgi:hypothetical protein
VASTNNFHERRRVLLLAAVTLAVELLVMPTAILALMEAAARWNSVLEIATLCIPRFIAMFILVLIFGPYRSVKWFSVFVTVYVILLAVRFSSSEIFIAQDAVAISRATLPYVSGVVATMLGLAFRREKTMGVHKSVVAPNH